MDEDAHRRRGDGLVELGVVVDEDGRLATQLEHDPFEVAGGGPDDELADLRGARERDLVDVGVLDECLSGSVTVAVDQVDDTVRHAGFGQDLLEDQRRQRGLLSGLEHAAAAGGQRRRELGGGVERRPVPRDDQPDDTDGFLDRVRVHRYVSMPDSPPDIRTSCAIPLIFVHQPEK